MRDARRRIRAFAALLASASCAGCVAPAPEAIPPPAHAGTVKPVCGPTDIPASWLQLGPDRALLVENHAPERLQGSHIAHTMTCDAHAPAICTPAGEATVIVERNDGHTVSGRVRTAGDRPDPEEAGFELVVVEADAILGCG